MDIGERLLSCTVRLETESSVGTGFFYKMRVETNGDFKPVIVTNRHVLEDANELSIRLRCEHKDGSIINRDFPITNLEGNVVFHPNPDIDLAVFPFPGLYVIASLFELTPLITYVSEEDIPNENEIEKLSPIEDVIVIGYPNGLWDDINVRPLVRRGITASDYKLDYQNKPQFIIDCSIFPGSSGSPVFLYNTGPYQEGNDVFLTGVRVKFLGINSSVFIQNLEGDIVERHVPTKLSTVSRLPIGLGIIIKANQLKEMEELLPE
ncbi:serine protease [Enterococcus faecalis]